MLVGVLASRAARGVVAVVNPWILVQVGVVASRVSGVLWLW